MRSIRAQDYRPLETVVVDNYSDDRTPQIATQYADQLLVAGPERSAQRNVGVQAARGDYVLWIDADMILPSRAVSSAMRAATVADADAVSIPEISVGPGFWTACRALERSCYLDDPRMYYPRLIKRAVLVEIGGFTERMAGPEDVDLRLRMDERHAVLRHCSDVHILHDEGRLTMRSILAKRVYYGRSLPSFAGDHPGALAEQGRQTLDAFLRHRRRLLRHPVLTAGIGAMRASEAVAYGIGYRQGRRRTPGRTVQ